MPRTDRAQAAVVPRLSKTPSALVTRIARALVGRRTEHRIFSEAVPAAIAAYGSALLGVQVASLVDAQRWGLVLVHGGIGIATVALIYGAASSVGHAMRGLTERRIFLQGLARKEEEAAISAVHERLAETATSRRRSPYVPHDALAAISAEVGALYRILDSSEPPPPVPGEGIKFEVTFMTRSYRDGEITIPAWANRESKAPISLTMRKTNKRIYEGSITADIYRESLTRRPRPRMFESTQTAGDAYQELYEGEKDRLRSTIIYPILGIQTDLVGTLVAHCDREGFFRNDDREFWFDLLEPFAARIALEKRRLDATVELGRASLPASVKPF